MARQTQAARALAIVALILAVTTASAAKVCVMVLSVQKQGSPFNIYGNVTRPLPADITLAKTLKPKTVGSVYLRLPGLAPCPNITADNVQPLLRAAQIVTPIGRPGITVDPPRIDSTVLTDSGDQLAAFNFTGFDFAVESNAPLGDALPIEDAPAAPKASMLTAQPAGGAGAPIPVEIIVLNGSLALDSILGVRYVNMTLLAANQTLTAAALVATQQPGGAVSAITLTLGNVVLPIDISPENTPGVHSTKASVFLGSNVTAAAQLQGAGAAKALVEVDEEELHLRCSPRNLAPVVVGGGETKVKERFAEGGCPGPATATGGVSLSGGGSGAAGAAGSGSGAAQPAAASHAAMSAVPVVFAVALAVMVAVSYQ